MDIKQLESINKKALSNLKQGLKEYAKNAPNGFVSDILKNIDNPTLDNVKALQSKWGHFMSEQQNKDIEKEIKDKM